MIYYNSENTIIFLNIKKIIYYYWIKYINIRYYYIKKRVKNGEIKLLYISISKITVNDLMKPLLTPLFIKNIE